MNNTGSRFFRCRGPATQPSNPTAWTVTGDAVGELALPEGPSLSFAVSPEGIWVAWVPNSAGGSVSSEWPLPLGFVVLRKPASLPHNPPQPCATTDYANARFKFSIASSISAVFL